jgi:hypothetical protein
MKLRIVKFDLTPEDDRLLTIFAFLLIPECLAFFFITWHEPLSPLWRILAYMRAFLACAYWAFLESKNRKRTVWIALTIGVVLDLFAFLTHHHA